MDYLSLVPILFLLFLKYNLHKSLFYILNSLFLCYFFFLGNLTIWCFFTKDCSAIIFAYYFGAMIFIYIVICIIYHLRFYFIFLSYKPLFITIIFAIFYHSTMISGHMVIIPVFYPLLFLVPWLNYGLPFFTPMFPWIYCFLYLVCIHHLKFHVVLVYGLIGWCFFFHDCSTPYWGADHPGDQNELSKYYYQGYYVFPEGYLIIYNQDSLLPFLKLSEQTHTPVILGCHWQELSQPYEQNGVAIITPNKNITWKKKYPVLPFAETDTIYQPIKSDYTDEYKNIYICSEFFLLPLTSQIKISEPLILVASTEWTKTRYTFWGKYIMQLIYQLYQFSIVKKI